MQGQKAYADLVVRFRIFNLQAASDGIELRARLMRGHARLQPRPDVEIISVPELAWVLIGNQGMSGHAPGGGEPKFAVLVGRKVRRHHADNGVLLAIEADGAADNRAIRGKIALPQAIPKRDNVIVTGLR